MFARAGPASLGQTGAGGDAARPQIGLGPPDYRAFEQLLQDIQAAWSAHDVNALGALVTPEMLSYFADQLAGQTSRGVCNEVTDVRLLQGDLAQSWTEHGGEYAAVAMRFSMIDVTRDSFGRIVEGSPTEGVSATELWTFVRSPWRAMDPFGHPAGAVTARCCTDVASASRLCYLLRLGHGDGYSIVALGSGPLTVWDAAPGETRR
jgi:predicted lipid-binding transport protein (Tim44 family)